MGSKISGLSLEPNTQPSIFQTLGLDQKVFHHQIGDIRDLLLVKKQIQEFSPEIVLHLAAQPLVRESYRDPVGTFNTNIMGTIHILEAIRECPSVKSVVLVTTDKCYENQEWPWGYRETDPMGGKDPYSGSKGACELAIHSYRRSFFSEPHHPIIASARAGNVIGGGDWCTDRLIPDAMRSFTQSSTLKIRRPESTRPWQHVIEPLRGYLLLAQTAYLKGHTFAKGWNFGPEDRDILTVKDVMNRYTSIWKSLTQQSPQIEWGDSSQETSLPEANLLKLDCSLAKAELGWAPKIPLQSGLEMTAKWYERFYHGTPEKELTQLTLAQIEEWGK